MTKLVQIFMFFLFMAVAVFYLSKPASADIARFKMIAPGIYRGGQPENELDYRRLAQTYKIKTIINLRTTQADIVHDRERTWANGMIFMSMPMNPVLGPKQEEVEQVLKYTTDPYSQPVFIHCNYGKDRTGLVIALYRHLIEKWDSARAFNEALSMGFNPFLFGLTWYFWFHATDLD